MSAAGKYLVLDINIINMNVANIFDLIKSVLDQRFYGDPS